MADIEDKDAVNEEVMYMVGMISNSREYVRIEDSIPVYYVARQGVNIVDSALNIRELKHFSRKMESISSSDNPEMYSLLLEINQRLKALMSQTVAERCFEIPEARIEDISGGGLKILCNKDFAEGDRLVIRLFLPDQTQDLEVMGEVVWTCENIDGGYKVGIQFVDIDERVRERIVRYIFAWQRRMLRSGKKAAGRAK